MDELIKQTLNQIRKELEQCLLTQNDMMTRLSELEVKITYLQGKIDGLQLMMNQG